MSDVNLYRTLARTLREVAPTISRTLAWIDRQGGIEAIRSRIDAEVDRRIAIHPDLSELDDWLDDMYGEED